MNWNLVTGSKGRCKVGIRTYINENNGEERKYNEIKKFYEAANPEPAAFKPGTF